MTNQQKAYIYAAFAVLLWSTAASAFKISLRYLDFLHLLLFSSFFASLVLFIFLVIQKKFNLIFSFSRKEYLHSLFLGFLNPFLYYLILFKAYELLPAQEAQPLNFIWPLMIVLFSIPILKQKIKFKNIISLLICFLGVIIISTQGNIFSLKFSNSFGVGLALFSSIIWAFFFILNVKDKRDEIVKLFLSFIFGFFYILIFSFVFVKIDFPSIKGILGTIYISLFEMAITFFVWLKALTLSDTTAKVNNLIYLTPFLSLIFINFMVGEKILLSTFIGLIFIVTGILSSSELVPKPENIR